MARIASHGRRRDPTGQRRADPERTAFNPAGSAYAADPLDLASALDGFLVETGANLYGQAPIGLHLLVGVSPEWVRETGCLHDTGNVRNTQVAKEAVAWVETTLGGDRPCVFAWRQDLDEAGGGVVDVFAAPTRVSRLNRAAEKRIASVTPALKALHTQYPGDPTAFGALQTSWAEHAQTTLDPALRRGVRKAESFARHLDPDRYGRMMDAAKTAAAAEADRILAERRAELDARERALASAEARVATNEARLTADKKAVVARARSSVTAAVNALALGVQAFVDGRIAGLEPNPKTGRLTLVQGAHLDPTAWTDLMDALGPGWPAGLRAALEHLQAGAEQVIESRGLSHAPSPFM